MRECLMSSLGVQPPIKRSDMRSTGRNSQLCKFDVTRAYCDRMNSGNEEAIKGVVT